MWYLTSKPGKTCVSLNKEPIVDLLKIYRAQSIIELQFQICSTFMDMYPFRELFRESIWERTFLPTTSHMEKNWVHWGVHVGKHTGRGEILSLCPHLHVYKLFPTYKENRWISALLKTAWVSIAVCWIILAGQNCKNCLCSAVAL